MRLAQLAVLVVLGVNLAVAGGPVPATPAHARPPAAKAATAAGPTDAQLEKAIRERFARSKINADKFTVKVQGGVAILDGKTEVIQRKGTATRLAKLAGAARVDNRIEVSEAARQKAMNNLESGRRRAQVKRSEKRTEASGR